MSFKGRGNKWKVIKEEVKRLENARNDGGEKSR